MTRRMQWLFDKLTARPKRLFLADALGALLAAFFLGVVLVIFEAHFGMPRHILYILSSIACMYMLYSLCCAVFVKGNWRPYLKAIAIANILYGCLTMALIVYHYQRLTVAGRIYFLLEMMALCVLTVIELKVLYVKKPGSN